MESKVSVVLKVGVFRGELCSGRQDLLRDGVQCMLGNVVLGVVFGAQSILEMVSEVTSMLQRCGGFSVLGHAGTCSFHGLGSTRKWSRIRGMPK